MIGGYDDPETWRERARGRKAAADRANDGAARFNVTMNGGAL